MLFLHGHCPNRYLNWVKLGHIFVELNFEPIFEQVIPSGSSGKSLGADLPPRALKGPKSAGFYMVLGQKSLMAGDPPPLMENALKCFLFSFPNVKY